MNKKDRIKDAINKLGQFDEKLLAFADDLNKMRCKRAENEVRNALGSLEYACVLLHEQLNKLDK